MFYKGLRINNWDATTLITWSPIYEGPNVKEEWADTWDSLIMLME